MKLMNKILPIALFFFLSSIASFAQDLRVTNQRGVEFRSKPSLSQRISGVRTIYVFYPRSSAQNDRYIYQNFKVYLQRLGLQVVDRGIAYKQIDASQGTVKAYILSCTENIGEYINEVNSLAVVINIAHMYGQYNGERMTATFNFVDLFNEYDWSVQIEPASTAERYIRQCQSSICSSYTYNSSYAYQPPFLSSNYSYLLLKTYIDKGEYTAIEGVYEGDDYTLGVKRGTDGTYYLLYHSSKSGAPGWQDGYVKAVLRESSTPGVYRATWYGRYFTKMDYKVIFEKGMFTSYNEQNDKDLFLKMYPTVQMEAEQVSKADEWSGTGFALNNGYIATNYHVVDGAKSIEVHGVNGNVSSNYTASVVATDKTNDLAIIRITDSRFSGFGVIPYAIKSQIVDVGEDVWVLGYPLTQVLGNEIKLTNGVVSSRSGYQGDVATYQISAPVQPGNSGGPLFDAQGNVVGIVNAGVPGAENVGYAIKTSYLKNLADSYSLSSVLPTTNSISSLVLKDQVKKVNNYVFHLICSAKAGSYSSTTPSSSSGNEMSLSRNSLALNVGETYTLSVFNYGTSIKWESSNTNVATVSSTGTVTGVGEGTALIWAIGTKAVFCSLTVNKAPNSASSSSKSNISGSIP